MTKDPLMCIVVRLKHSQLAQLKALGLSIGSDATAEDVAAMIISRMLPGFSRDRDRAAIYLTASTPPLATP